MEYRIRPRGVCAKEMMVEVDEQGVVQELKVMAAATVTCREFLRWLRGCPLKR